MELAQSFPSNMGIDLGGRQITVTKQHLNNPQIGTMIEQMGGEGRPESMR